MAIIAKNQEAWRKALKIVPADYMGVRVFRQFRIKVDVPLGFNENFLLHSMHKNEMWQPRQNIAKCLAPKAPAHAVPDANCACGFYASYSSSIIYSPGSLSRWDYCFAAIRAYGENMPFAEYGIRSGGADVEGLLFSVAAFPLIRPFLKKLNQENIFFTFSAQEFLARFPDESYSEILGFDPVERIGDLTIVQGREDWEESNFSFSFRRPILPRMLQRHQDNKTGKYRVSIKPEYRPGGSHYRHPLLEVWKR